MTSRLSNTTAILKCLWGWCASKMTEAMFSACKGEASKGKSYVLIWSANNKLGKAQRKSNPSISKSFKGTKYK